MKTEGLLKDFWRTFKGLRNLYFMVYKIYKSQPPGLRDLLIFKVRISDLSSVDINWRMLTLARPESKIEEEIFSK